MTEEIPLAEQIAALRRLITLARSNADHLRRSDIEAELGSLRAILEAYPRVVAECDVLLILGMSDDQVIANAVRERDVAHAELAEVRGVIAKLRDLLDDQGESFAEARAEIERLRKEGVRYMTNRRTDRIGLDVYWQDLLDKDDRTSPEDHPEMALITREELLGYINEALAEVERLRTPPSKDAMEAALKIVPKGFLADCRALFSYSLEDAAEDKLRQDIARAIIAAREAEREKCRAVVEQCVEIARRQKSEAELEKYQGSDENKAYWLWAFDPANSIEREIRDTLAALDDEGQQ